MDADGHGAGVYRSPEPSAVNRRGFILAAALLVMVLVAALIAGVFFATMEETHIADTASSREAALIAAESAIETAIGSWADRNTQQIGVAGQELSTISVSAMSVALIITRLDSALYSIVAQAGSASSKIGAMRRIGVIVGVRNAIDHSILVDPIPERWWSELF
jgi:type II secretory pathway pseudopilin PulG